MVAELLRLGSSSGFTVVQFSGTQFTNNQTVGLTLLCAMSGLAVIPVRCDSTGRIGSIA